MFGSVVEEFRPAGSLLFVRSGRRKREIEGLKALERIDHFPARREIGRSHLLPDFDQERVIWILEGHHCAGVTALRNCSWTTTRISRLSRSYDCTSGVTFRFRQISQIGSFKFMNISFLAAEAAAKILPKGNATLKSTLPIEVTASTFDMLTLTNRLAGSAHLKQMFGNDCLPRITNKHICSPQEGGSATLLPQDGHIAEGGGITR